MVWMVSWFLQFWKKVSIFVQTLRFEFYNNVNGARISISMGATNELKSYRRWFCLAILNVLIIFEGFPRSIFLLSKFQKQIARLRWCLGFFNFDKKTVFLSKLDFLIFRKLPEKLEFHFPWEQQMNWEIIQVGVFDHTNRVAHFWRALTSNFSSHRVL